MNREEIQRLQELPVVPSFCAARWQAGPDDLTAITQSASLTFVGIANAQGRHPMNHGKSQGGMWNAMPELVRPHAPVVEVQT